MSTKVQTPGANGMCVQMCTYSTVHMRSNCNCIAIENYRQKIWQRRLPNACRSPTWLCGVTRMFASGPHEYAHKSHA